MSTLRRQPAPADRPPVPARPGIAFLSWGAVAGRSEDIARAVGGEARCFFAPGPTRRPPVLLRWLLSGLGTVRYLLSRRPEVVIVTNPPVFAPLVAIACARLIGAAVVLDSHPGGFGAQGDRVAARLQRLHRWAVRHSVAVLVTDDAWAERVRAWGGTPLVFHEAPPPHEPPPPSRHDRLHVLVVGRLGADEPVDAVLEAARSLPGLDFSVTGDPVRLAPGALAGAPDNVAFVGFLGPAAYAAAVEASDVVLALTTEPSSVMRAAYEAVYARRPLVVSDWPVARALFPYASLTDNQPAEIAGALGALEARYGEAVATLEAARLLQVERFEAQRAALLAILGSLGPH